MAHSDSFGPNDGEADGRRRTRAVATLSGLTALGLVAVVVAAIRLDTGTTSAVQTWAGVGLIGGVASMLGSITTRRSGVQAALAAEDSSSSLRGRR